MGNASGGTTALERMMAMQRELEAAQAEQVEVDGFVDRLGEHLDRIDRLRRYEDQWMTDREELLAGDDGQLDLPILGEDHLWELQENHARQLRRLLTRCATGLSAELSIRPDQDDV